MTISHAHEHDSKGSLAGVRRSTVHRSSLPLSNQALAERLEEVAQLLEAQNANPFRVKAYRNAADTVRNCDRAVCTLLSTEGLAGLRRLPGIGESLARTIEQLVFTGRFDLLDRLRGGSGSIDLFATVPGIGPTLARRIHEELEIGSLQELELAAYDGRLSRVQGMGLGRVRAVQESLAGRFRHWPGLVESSHARAEASAPLSELLDIDREYREKAAAKELPLIAPRRFNPGGETWLPVMHAHRGERHYTALFSNTARAHELGTTHDWVVIYRDDHDGQGQWTVVTAQQGSPHGKRIVRGREAECQQYYAEG